MTAKITNVKHLTKKKIASDFILNLIATFILAFVTHFVLQRQLSLHFTENKEQYGLILTLLALCTTVSSSVGTSMNNVRLLENSNNNNDLKYNFKPLLLIFAGACSTILFFIAFFYYKTNWLISSLLLIFAFLQSLSNYYQVTFRISLNYKKIFILNLILSSIYAVGAFTIKWTANFWPIIYIAGEVANICFIKLFGNFPKESFHFSTKINIVFKSFLFLFITSVFATIFNYLDRFLGEATLGSESVAIYSVASLYGKIIGMVITPISSIMLSYYSTQNIHFTRRTFWSINIIGLFLSWVAFVLSPKLAPFLIKIFNADYLNECYPYIILCSCATIIYASAAIINPAILKYCGTKYSVILTFIHGSIYLISAIVLIKQFSLFGLCYASIIANSIYLILSLIIGDTIIGKQNKQDKR